MDMDVEVDKEKLVTRKMEMEEDKKIEDREMEGKGRWTETFSWKIIN
jgi:hypothetical protein